jgi:predicted RNA-binding protein Jag
MMKSIMEEASSVIKAIEKGWIQAGKPQEFTIKVFEEATKNFIGMTVKPAKIAIFFQEKAVSSTQQNIRPTRQKQSPSSYAKTSVDTSSYAKTNRGEETKPASARKPVTAHKPQQQQARATQPTQTTHDQGEKKQRDAWTPEMVNAAQGWMQGLLDSLDKQGLTFSTEVKSYYLKINVATPVLDDTEQEKALFRNCAYLIMQSLRNKFKKSFRGFKIILSSAR